MVVIAPAVVNFMGAHFDYDRRQGICARSYYVESGMYTKMSVKAEFLDCSKMFDRILEYSIQNESFCVSIHFIMLEKVYLII